MCLSLLKKKTLPHHQTQQNKCHALVNQQGPEWKKRAKLLSDALSAAVDNSDQII